MADAVRSGEGWRVTPADYAKTRPAAFAVGPPRSLYVTMRDGCRLALDVYLPQSTASSDAPRSKLPTLLILTPYYRRFKLRPGAPATTEPSPNAGKWRDLFVPRGYAVVVCDVRGTGASFGTRDSFRSPAEREDYREIADWIVRQAWSDGSIGSTGISYVGAAADFLASTGHPAVKAVAPLFAVWDTYSDHYYPGGLLLNRLAETYDELMIALDQDRRDLLGKFAYFKDPNFDGPQPVDDDPEGRLVRAAVAEHQSNFRMTEFIREFRFKDDALASDPAVTPASFSPYGYCAGVDPDVAVYSVSGWYDGAGYANGGIARFLTLPNPQAAPAAGAVGPRRAHQWLAVARAARARVSAARRGPALLRSVSDGPAHRPRPRSAGPLFRHARGTLARRRHLAAAGDSAIALSGAAAPPDR